MSKLKVTLLLIASLFALTACASKSITGTAVRTDDPSVESTTEAPAICECLNCHTDKQRLIDTAMLEVVVEKESTGAG